MDASVYNFLAGLQICRHNLLVRADLVHLDPFLRAYRIHLSHDVLQEVEIAARFCLLGRSLGDKSFV